eukprot:m51a1_g14214 hypothetical protein (809) ;mRNA; r:172132-175725
MASFQEMLYKRAVLKEGMNVGTSTSVTERDGRRYTVERGLGGQEVRVPCASASAGFVVDTKPDAGLHEVRPRLYVGSQDAAADADALVAAGVTHILNVGVGIPCKYPDRFSYCVQEIYDRPDVDILESLKPCLDFIAAALATPAGRVLVHCVFTLPAPVAVDGGTNPADDIQVVLSPEDTALETSSSPPAAAPVAERGAPRGLYDLPPGYREVELELVLSPPPLPDDDDANPLAPVAEAPCYARALMPDDGDDGLLGPLGPLEPLEPLEPPARVQVLDGAAAVEDCPWCGRPSASKMSLAVHKARCKARPRAAAAAAAAVAVEGEVRGEAAAAAPAGQRKRQKPHFFADDFDMLESRGKRRRISRAAAAAYIARSASAARAHDRAAAGREAPSPAIVLSPVPEVAFVDLFAPSPAPSEGTGVAAAAAAAAAATAAAAGSSAYDDIPPPSAPPDEVPVGATFMKRMDMAKLKLHAPPMAGIWGNGREPCRSIVMSGGYEDDVDEGDCITYTGSGEKGDQDLKGGNKSLWISYTENRPFRVWRGCKLPSPFAPKQGYRYDGYYYIEHVDEKQSSGRTVIQFIMRRCPGQDPLPGPDDPPIRYPGDGALELQSTPRRTRRDSMREDFTRLLVENDDEPAERRVQPPRRRRRASRYGDFMMDEGSLSASDEQPPVSVARDVPVAEVLNPGLFGDVPSSASSAVAAAPASSSETEYSSSEGAAPAAAAAAAPEPEEDTRMRQTSDTEEDEAGAVAPQPQPQPAEAPRVVQHLEAEESMREHLGCHLGDLEDALRMAVGGAPPGEPPNGNEELL